MNKKSIAFALVLATLILGLFAPPTNAQTCNLNSRVIDPEGWVSESVKRSIDTQARNLDQYGIELYVYVPYKEDVESGYYTGDLAKLVQESGLQTDQGFCYLPLNSVIISIAPGVDPNGEYADYGVTEIVYGTQAVWVESKYLPGHSENIALELAKEVDTAIVNGTWGEEIPQALSHFGNALMQITAPAPVPTVRPTMAPVKPTQATVAKPTSAPTPQSTSKPHATENVPVATTQQDTPTQSGGGAFVWILVIGAIIGAGIAGWAIYQKLRKERKVTGSAQQRALDARAQVSNAIINWRDTLAQVEEALALCNGCDPEELKPLTAQMQRAQRLYDEASADFSELNGRGSVMDPEAPHSAEEYDNIRDRFAEIGKQLANAKETARGVIDQAGIIQQAIKTAPQEIEKAQVTITQAQEAIDGIREQGFTVASPIEQLGQASATLAAAQKALEGKRFGKASELADQASVLANAAADEAAELPVLKGLADNFIADLQERLPSLEAMAIKAQQAQAAAEDRFAADSLATISGNVAEARNRFNWAVQNLADARIAHEAQDWIRVRNEVQEAQSWIAEAGKLCEAVTQHVGRLDSAMANVQKLLGDTESLVQTALTAVQEHDVVMPENQEGELQVFSTRIAELRFAVSNNRPDIFAIDRELKEIASRTREIATAVEERDQRLQRLQHELEATLTEAQSSIVAAKAYANAQRHHIGSDTQGVLSSAESYLRSAEEGQARLHGQEDDALLNALAQVITAAKQADQAADRALAEAKKDVAEAEAAEEARRRYEREQEEILRRQQYSPPTPPIHVDVNVGSGGSSWGTSRPREEARPSWTPPPATPRSSPSITRPSRPSVPASSPARVTSVPRPSAPTRSAPSVTRPTRGR